jgi:hypothetical protein
MLVAAIAEAKLGVKAERRPLEEVAEPLSMADASQERRAGSAELARPVSERGLRA